MRCRCWDNLKHGPLQKQVTSVTKLSSFHNETSVTVRETVFFYFLLRLFRYIVFTIKQHDDEDEKQVAWKNSYLSSAIKQKVQQLYGDVGIATIRDGFDGNLVLKIMTVL